MSDGVKEPIRNDPPVDNTVPVNVPVPEGVPEPETPWNAGAEQFKDPADAVKSWKSAQQMVSQKDQRIAELEAQIAAASGQPESDPQGGDPSSPDEQPGDAAVSESTINWDSLDDYVDEESKWFKPEFSEQLAESSQIPKDVIDDFLGKFEFYRNAHQQAQQQQALEYVGGEDNYKALYAWAQENAPQAISLLNSDDQWQVTLIGLKGAMEAAGAWPGSKPAAPQEPSQAPGTGTNSAAEAPMSYAEFAKATLDPRYNTDRAYTDNVQRRYQAGLR